MIVAANTELFEWPNMHNLILNTMLTLLDWRMSRALLKLTVPEKSRINSADSLRE